nr:histone deacetylase HDT1-like isoform X2 [Ipomoea trifida]
MVTDDDDQESDSDEDSPLTFKAEPEADVKPEKQAGPEKSDVAKSSASDKKVKITEPHKDVKAEEDESSDEDMVSSDEDMDSSDGEDEDESDETPKKVESGKKRLAESSKKTPASDKNKKAKLETPQKTGGKKSSVHVATPYPVKQAKTAANKPNQSTPKSAGSHACKSCNRYMLICSYKVLWIPIQRLNIVLESDEYTELECLCIAYSPGLLISFCGSPNVKATLVSLLACSILVLESCQVSTPSHGDDDHLSYDHYVNVPHDHDDHEGYGFYYGCAFACYSQITAASALFK